MNASSSRADDVREVHVAYVKRFLGRAFKGVQSVAKYRRIRLLYAHDVGVHNYSEVVPYPALHERLVHGTVRVADDAESETQADQLVKSLVNPGKNGRP